MKSFFKYLILISLITNISYAISPKIFAHRGGGKEFPENTIKAFEEAIKAGADGIELDLQITKDNIVVLFHPRTLANKNVDTYTFVELRKINPEIPSFNEILDKFPNNEIIVDLKSLPAEPLIDAIVNLVDQKSAWHRLVFYSTNDDHLEYLKKIKPEAIIFESRKLTRERLLKMRNENICCCTDKEIQYAGFELSREMIVEESFALGKSTNKINFALWDKNAVQCFQNSLKSPTKIFLFGINSIESYKEAEKLGVYAIFTDNPKALIKELEK